MKAESVNDEKIVVRFDDPKNISIVDTPSGIGFNIWNDDAFFVIGLPARTISDIEAAVEEYKLEKRLPAIIRGLGIKTGVN